MVVVRILGPLELGGGGGGLGGQKPRRVLAVLALHANEVVAADRLMEAVWADDPPRSARANLLTYVSSLRRCLPAGGGLVIEARAPGYRLLAERGSLDWDVFSASAVSARRVVSRDPDRARLLLRAALGLWRGPVLADVADGLVSFAPRIAALEEARLGAQVLLMEAELRAGRAAEVVGELAELTQAHPLDERLCGLRMLALCQCGRQADGVEAYHRMRRRLREELGIDPGGELSGVFERVLRGDARLDAGQAPAGDRAVAYERQGQGQGSFRGYCRARQMPGPLSGRRAAGGRWPYSGNRDAGQLARDEEHGAELAVNRHEQGRRANA